MELETQCPQCGSKLFKNAPELDLYSDATCAGCGRTGKLETFLTPASRERIEKAVQEAAVKAFTSIPGFKK